MNSPLYIKIGDKSSVAVAINDIPAGTPVIDGVRARQDIPQVHKITLCDISKGGKITRYGVALGYAINPIGKGQWTNEKMLELPAPPSADEMRSATNPVTDLPKPPVDTRGRYINPNGGYAGTRNILGTSTTVQCVTGVLDAAVARMKSKLLLKYPNVDDVVSINHAYGCGAAINALEAKVSIRALKNLAKHPNLGGELMAAGLGYERFTMEMFLGQADISPGNVIILQEKEGFDDMVSSLMEMADRKLGRLNRRGRQTLSLSELLIDMQCGSSDTFSGVTANPSASYAADMLVKGGTTVLFSEVMKIRNGVYLLGERCVSEKVGKKLAAEMRWYDHYLESGQVDHNADLTPGNKKGGLSNIVEKAMGFITRSGISPTVRVLSSAEKPSEKGLIYAATLADDIVCEPCQLASGIELQVFMTGKGTPYGLAIAPVIKVHSRNDMKIQWQDLIDINVDPTATGGATAQDIGTQLFHEIMDMASGREQSHMEKYRLYSDLCVLSSAPIA